MGFVLPSLPGGLLVIDDFYCFFNASMLAAQVCLETKGSNAELFARR